MLFKIILLIILILPFEVFGNDLFGFLLEPCDLKYGVPISHNEGQLTIMNPNGKVETFLSEQLVGVAHYVLNESVFDLTQISEASFPFLKRFEVKEKNIKSL